VNKRKLLLRLIAMPFVLCIVLIAYNYHAFRNALHFLRYGGEWITYSKKDQKTIQDIFNELQNKKHND